MKVADLMVKDLVTIRPDSPVSEVVLSLADAHVSALPVVDDVGRVLGVVSSADLIAAEAEAEDDASRTSLFERTQVQEIMSQPARTITSDTTVREAARQMLYLDVHRLFVTEDDQLVGVVSTTDIVRAVATGKL